VTAALVIALAGMGLVAWLYAGYPLVLAVLAKVAPSPRRRAPLVVPISVVIAAHNEEGVIAAKVANVAASDYSKELVEIVVASDGSTDRTVELARAAGATRVLDLPRVGKIRALAAAAAAASAEILVFTDADSVFEPRTLVELVSNFADPRVGGVSGNQVTVASGVAGEAVVRGEGLYWRYEQWIKGLEDRIGSTVSAAGGLYAVRRELFREPTQLAGADDFLISTDVVRQGARLAFDSRARVVIEPPTGDMAALARKVRVMNGGLRGAFTLGRRLIPFVGGLYGFEVVSHKILRRFTAFFLGAALAAAAVLASAEPAWWFVLGPQIVFYACAAAGWLGRRHRFGRAKVFSVPYFFCLANLAGALAAVSLLRGVRFEKWEPSRVEAVTPTS
jgi:cellulose synthase/poly-beta-1,6-N-acetylglucosamine synthase-like glycosyltransferase